MSYDVYFHSPTQNVISNERELRTSIQNKSGSLMPKIFSLLLAFFGMNAQPAEEVIEMRQRFGPENTFSIMAPSNWVDGQGDRFSVNAPNNGPSLGGNAVRIPSRPEFKEYADARIRGVTEMGIYKQVGDERSLTPEGGVIREYEGIWPGDDFVTYYVVACQNAEDIYAAVALVTTKDDFTKNRVFYETMLSTFEVHP